MDLNKLQTELGYTFNDVAFLRAALLHRSYVHEHPEAGSESNERLEFLGDALLNFICGSFLFHEFPELGEGDLTKMRAMLVQTRTLASLARRFDLGSYVQISRGEERAKARERDNLLADAFEALLAAIALDGGWPAARDFVLPLLKSVKASGVQNQDYKTDLQQFVQGRINLTPNYREVNVTGPDHERTWTIEVWAGETLLGVGIGTSKTMASQAAAKVALEALTSETIGLTAPEQR
ncbi:ribonuclease III [Herpetosiphon giganteus]|uniref:ribonuclease III n=1 Tax=Herpetosiphon giganteus TaxID=2029754 RepID=UPI0019585CCC|nr:ribonuclease III [Herpetosiphon giganteus]MBM7846318.1 ribonuclease-3 [Herpetosiphon giganteus]